MLLNPLLLCALAIPQQGGPSNLSESLRDDGDFNGFEITADDSNYVLALGGKLENDWATFSSDSSLNTHTGGLYPGTEFRRARLAIGGSFGKLLDFKTTFDFGDDGGGFKDVWVETGEIPFFKTVKVGHFKEPFSLESMTSSSNMPMMERSLLTALSPGRNVGFMARGTAKKKILTWAIGVFRETNSGAFGADEGAGNEFALTARGTWLPWWSGDGKRLAHLGLGISLRNPDEGIVDFKSRPESHLAPYFFDTGDIQANQVLLLNLEGALKIDSTLIQAEITRATVESQLFYGPFNFSSSYMQVSHFFSGESRKYKRSKGSFSTFELNNPYQRKGDAIGALEGGLRFSQIKLTDGNIGGGNGDVLSAGLNWHLTKNLKCQVNGGLANLETFGAGKFVQLRFHLDW